MNKRQQETPFSEKTIKFRPDIVCVCVYIGLLNRSQRLLKGGHLFPFHPVFFSSWLSLIFHRCGASGSIRACHAADPGSIPGRDRFPG